MKEKSDFVALLFGLIASFIVGLILGSLDMLFFFIRAHVAALSSLRDPFLTPFFIIILSSHLVECLCGSIVVGYFSKGKSMVLGTIFAYGYLCIRIIIILVDGMFHSFSPLMKITTNISLLKLSLICFLHASVVFIGLLGGKVGELLRRKGRIPSGA